MAQSQPTMRAVVVFAFGEPESFEISRVAVPAPSKGEVCVRVEYAAVNFVDALVASGAYQVKPTLPFIPGGEFAGTVVSVGAGVTRLNPGDGVCCSTLGGGFAEYAVVKADLAFKAPEGMPLQEAAVFRVSNATAYHGLVQRAQLRSTDTVLVLGAGGAVGYAAVQIASAMGARVIASTSTDAKRESARLAGAASVIDSDPVDWRSRLKATAPDGLDVVVDTVGGSFTELAFRSLRWRGRHLVIGFASGEIGRLPANLALVKGASLLGVDIRQFSLLERDASLSNMTALFALRQAGKLKPQPVRTFAMKDFSTALNIARRGGSGSRLTLSIQTDKAA